MAIEQYKDEEETRPLTYNPSTPDKSRISLDSVTSASTTSIALERLNASGQATNGRPTVSSPTDRFHKENEGYDEEDVFPHQNYDRPVDKRTQRVLWVLGGLCLSGWLVALVLFLSRQSYRHPSTLPHNPAATASAGSGKAVTLEEVLGGVWRATQHELSWIAGATGEDGLLLEREGGSGRDYLVVEDVRSGKGDSPSMDSVTLMKHGSFKVNGVQVYPNKVWPSQDLKKVLVISEEQRNWRHSYTGKYWIYDVDSQEAEALDPADPGGRIQLASWSPRSNAIVFTRDNNMFLRDLSSQHVSQITQDGGSELFYGIPDWVYEEEVLSHNSATWWSEDGDFIAFLRTNETTVPQYPIQYFVSRPSGKIPPPGEENYPEVRQIKYPKAGAPNPVVDLQFYDVSKKQVFKVDTDTDFPDDTRLTTEVVWAGKDGKLLVKETNRESDILKVALIDVRKRTGKVVRTVDVNGIDGGWFEVSENTRFIPSDPGNGRAHSGYVDTVIHDGYDHLAYFTPLDNPDPILLTSGPWEVVNAPSAIDLTRNLVYFVATKESPIQRHVYSVKLDGSDLQAISDTSKEGYYDISFSTGSGYALLSYQGPGIPWQKVVSTPSNPVDFEHQIEDNEALARTATEHELPIDIYQTVNFDGYDLNVVERRPPHFDDRKKYPVIFHLYGGPGSQTVDKKFTVDFQAYLASSLGYIVVTVDGRGTGFIGRKARCVVRGTIGFYEALDQIATAKTWAKKKYVDAERMAIWGWSYGGFMTLKTLELDGGNTFKYGMAVAPVTDWRFYDSIYTERYMHTPQVNPQGYMNTSITNVTALQSNVRFLLMHGVADDNVHMQNSLTLLDKLDIAGVENYDVHVFPDSDHGIYFHNANKMVYDRLSNWLINAFNGEWLRTEGAVPLGSIGASTARSARQYLQKFAKISLGIWAFSGKYCSDCFSWKKSLSCSPQKRDAMTSPLLASQSFQNPKSPSPNKATSTRPAFVWHLSPLGIVNFIMSDMPILSQSSKELLVKVRMIVPPMLEKFHKGQLGRVAVIGGSENYTGAPYFSAMASARLGKFFISFDFRPQAHSVGVTGADLSHVFCTPVASAVIKTYSPNLMVHPLMRETPDPTPAASLALPIIALFPHLHVLVIGPGLGRDPLMQETVAEVIRAARRANLSLVLDADALFAIQKDPDLIQGYKDCVLTPNVVEFSRLAKALGVDADGGANDEDAKKGCKNLAQALGGVVIVRKGRHDWISNGEHTVVSDMQGGRKRSGGQGDTLTGCIGTLLAWRKLYLEHAWDTQGKMSQSETLTLAAWGGSAITRECSRRAFAKMGRSLQASDLTGEVGGAFLQLVGEVGEDE